MNELTALVLAMIAGTGMFLVVMKPSVRQQSARRGIATFKDNIDNVFIRAGLGNVDRRSLVGTVVAICIAGVALGMLVFGGVSAPIATGVLLGTLPIASFKARATAVRARASEAWPNLIEEIRLRCGSLGQPVPQALLEAGKEGPSEMRNAFAAAEREWLMSTNFAETISVLKQRLADPTADVACETLLMAHAVGGNDVEKRLIALAEDRRADLNGRKDARSKQAGVRFARRFVLIVPAGMALVGMSIGDGRDAYSTPLGQLGVVLSLMVLATCWIWAGRLIRLPEETRVFRD